MPALRDLQRSFASALFEGAGQPTRDPRIDIYRNNVRVGFAKALSITFPVIERLMGEQYFSHLAEDFRLAQPSRSGDLHAIGATFAGFLREKFAGTQYAYFPDVAALEWAYQECQVAADEDPIDATSLRGVDPALYESLRLSLHPAARLIHSQFPIVRIWQANQPEARGEEAIDLGAGGDHVLVLRTDDGIEFHRLPGAHFVALSALAAGQPLGEALANALDADAAFDPAAALQRFFRLKLFTALRT